MKWENHPGRPNRLIRLYWGREAIVREDSNMPHGTEGVHRSQRMWAASRCYKRLGIFSPVKTSGRTYTVIASKDRSFLTINMIWKFITLLHMQNCIVCNTKLTFICFNHKQEPTQSLCWVVFSGWQLRNFKNSGFLFSTSID